MGTEKTDRDFEFHSPLSGILFLWLLGIGPVLYAIDFIPAWGVKGGNWVPPDLAYRLFLLVWGGMVLNSVSDVEIRDGQLRFRKYLYSKSVPLQSVTRVRLVFGILYLRVDDAGKRYRMIFYSESFWPGVSPPPVIGFLRDVCRRNVAVSAQER